MPENRKWPTVFVDSFAHRIKKKNAVQDRSRGCNRKVNYWLCYGPVKVRVEIGTGDRIIGYQI
jgi:hypothetical protein